MARFIVQHKATGVRLATTDGDTWDQAVESFLSTEPGRDYTPDDLRAEPLDDRLAVLVRDTVHDIRCALTSATMGTIAPGTMLPEARGCALVLTAGDEEVGSFTLDTEESGTGHGLLYGLTAWSEARGRALLMCCSEESVSGNPALLFRGAALVTPADRRHLGDTVRVLDGLMETVERGAAAVICWRRARNEFQRIAD